jgi:SAM-dependent methyltransferase
LNVTELPGIELPGHKASVEGGPDHPMRHVTRQAAGIDAGGWDASTREVVSAVFDGLAAEWHTRISPQRIAVVVDALDRGLGPDRRTGLCVEVGSGIGTYSELLAGRFDTVAAVDLALEMLRLAPAAPGRRVQADASQLPLANGAARAVVLINAFLFPSEVARVLAADGIVVWVNSSGESTPIHLSTEEVVGALPGEWAGVASRAGLGTWCVLHRQ